MINNDTFGDSIISKNVLSVFLLDIVFEKKVVFNN